MTAPDLSRLSGFDMDPVVDRLPFGVRVYVVGGAVRDALLGLPVHDRDWVVVGATPEHMVQAGFTPVGADFPVFLHPVTHEEYALARTERKTAPGYKGFVFHADPAVTLEQDLLRRDFTVNAMAMDAQGTLIDVCNGPADLQKKRFRHVGPAFAEDPLRVLRLARFMARFTAFTVAPDTLLLCHRMVAQGEMQALVAERIWQELSRGLNEAAPERMVQTLVACKALAPLCGHERTAEKLARTNALVALAAQAKGQGSTPQGARLLWTWAAWMAAAGLSRTECEDVSSRWKLPREVAELGLMAVSQSTPIVTAQTPQAVLAVLQSTDALRRPERFLSLLGLINAMGSLNVYAEDPSHLQPTDWQAAIQALKAMDLSQASEQARTQGVSVQEWVARARIAALEAVLPPPVSNDPPF